MGKQDREKYGLRAEKCKLDTYENENVKTLNFVSQNLFLGPFCVVLSKNALKSKISNLSKIFGIPDELDKPMQNKPCYNFLKILCSFQLHPSSLEK